MILGITEVIPGMILSEDILLPNGVILLNSPSTITSAHIQMLKKRGIGEIHVENPIKETDAADSASNSEKTAEHANTISSDNSDKIEVPKVTEADLIPVAPKITVSVAFDSMSANLRIEPAGHLSTPVTPDGLLSALKSEGVIFGIRQNMIADLANRWANVKRIYETDKIAIGEPPKPGRQGQLELLVSCINTAKHFQVVQKVSHCNELHNCGFQFDRADPGTIIARRQETIPPVMGINVKGEEIQTTEITPVKITRNETVSVSEDGTEFISSVTGIPFFLDGAIGVHPVDFDAKAELKVSQDKMTAELIIIPATHGGRPLEEASIQDLLAKEGATSGVKETFIAELLLKMKNGKYPDGPVIIAQGTPPINGKDGLIEFLFSTQTSLTPKLNPDGSVDFKNVDLIHSVVSNTQLARLISPENGVEGVDITGRTIPGKNGKKAVLPKGANTKPDEKDDTVLLAAIDGNVTYNGHTVDVHEGYVVDGHIDYSTGNVHYEKSVLVKGDIKSGFSVECGGDLEVHGTIEDAEVNVTGTVLCKFGFTGQGKGHIDARGDVNINFMKNQTVRARGNVIIAREALNCTIMSRKNITISGKPLSAAGGTLVARDSIILREVGNHSGIKTVLEVGTDFILAEELAKTDKFLKELNENCRALIESYKRFEMVLRIKKKLPPKEEFTFQKLRNTIGQVNQQIKSLEKRKKLIMEKISDRDKAYIKVEYAAMPGTIFKFGDRHIMLNAQLIGPKYVRFIDNEIKII